MLDQKKLKMGKTPRTVIRGVSSQVLNEVGIDWLRISCPRQYLKPLKTFLDFHFGASSQDGRGLFSYDSRYIWLNKGTLNYDLDIKRSDNVHGGTVCLDLPGRVMQEIEQTDLHLFLIGLRIFHPKCTRIDVFFDDYNRNITPSEMHNIIKNKDFSGFRRSQIKQQYNGECLEHDEIDFGRRGQNGSGQYLRIYDKALESKGKKNCIRFEVEFTGERANKVFDKLSHVTSVDALATLCGALIGGSIRFVHRNGDKNITRLDVYDFWKKILKFLGSVVIRVSIKKTDIAGKYKFIYRQVTPTLALLRDTFVDDTDFFNWLNDAIGEGELRMSQTQINLSRANKRKLRYSDGRVFDNYGVLISERI